MSISFRCKTMKGPFLAIGVLLAAVRSAADLRVTRVLLDGQARTGHPLVFSSGPRFINFEFSEFPHPASRLKYKLDGVDPDWRDLPTAGMVRMVFDNRQGHIVGGREIQFSGQTPGWNGSPAASRFSSYTETVTVPEHSAEMRLSFISHGSVECMGIIGIDQVQLVLHGSNASERLYDLGIHGGDHLDQSFGTPYGWFKQGSRNELARLGQRPLPVPHPILTIEDDDPRNYGNWSSSRKIPVTPGSSVTLNWSAAYSLGRCGPGSVSYEALPPGRYIFRIAKAKLSGELTEEQEAFTFTITPPFYLRLEFWLMALVSFSGMLVWFTRLLTRRRLQMKLSEMAVQQQMAQDRARIARDLHDNIGAGLSEIAMQSDWVFNDLSAHAGLPDVQNRIVHIRQSAMDLARAVDEIVWAITPANDTLRRFVNYLIPNAAQFADAANIAIRFDVPDDIPERMLPGKIRHALYLAIREALNNAIRHAGAALIRLDIRFDRETLRVTVADDGRGFNSAQPASAEGVCEGLDGMRRRMEELGGSFHLETVPGAGTRITFQIPLPSIRITTV